MLALLLGGLVIGAVLFALVGLMVFIAKLAIVVMVVKIIKMVVSVVIISMSAFCTVGLIVAVCWFSVTVGGFFAMLVALVFISQVKGGKKGKK